MRPPGSIAGPAEASPGGCRAEWPAGLSDRGVEVLRLLCRGEPKPGIGSELGISPSSATGVTSTTSGVTIAPMDEFDISLRNLTYGQFVELGHAPTVAQVAGLAGSTDDEVRGAWRRLHDAHALTLNASTAEIRMASPFSATPTAYRVHAADRWWYANCAWDAFGIFGALHADGRIEASCPDCGEAITIEVHDERPDDTTLLFHCLLPASRWWNDIVFT